LHRKYPDDPDAAAFYGLSLLGTAHEGRDFSIYMRAAAVLEEVFRIHPNHPGAAHYLIHSYDDPIHAPLGLRAARVYSRIAPSAPHAQHMTSHIFVALGMWQDVVTANENAISVGGAHQEAGHKPRACGHYPFWLLYGYLQQGRQQDAKKILQACRESALKDVDLDSEGSLDPDYTDLGSYVEMRSRYMLDTEGWKSEVAGWSVPTGKRLVPKLTQDFVAGFGAIRLGDVQKAREALEDIRKAYGELEAHTKNTKDADQSYLQRAEILKQQLEALVLLAEDKKTEAVDLLRKAAAAEESMPFNFGPPFVDKPTRELLGEVFLELGRPQDASVEFKSALARAPGRTSSLLGLAQAASQSGDKKKAEETYAKLREIWKHADQVPEEVR
jgi:tetratricopeptide (TPR) repeat protein